MVTRMATTRLATTHDALHFAQEVVENGNILHGVEGCAVEWSKRIGADNPHSLRAMRARGLRV